MKKEYYTVSERLAYTPQLIGFVMTNHLAQVVIPKKKTFFKKAGNRIYYDHDLPGMAVSDELIQQIYGDNNGNFDQSKTVYFTTLESAKAIEAKRMAVKTDTTVPAPEVPQPPFNQADPVGDTTNPPGLIDNGTVVPDPKETGTTDPKNASTPDPKNKDKGRGGTAKKK